MMKGKEAIAQFVLLGRLYKNYPFDLSNEIKTNHLAIFLHYPFWMQYDFTDEGEGISIAERDKVLDAMQKYWLNFFPTIPLPKISNQQVLPAFDS